MAAIDIDFGTLELEDVRQHISNSITAAAILCGFAVTFLTLILTTIFTENLPYSIYIEIWVIIILLSICSFLICIEFYLSASKRTLIQHIRKIGKIGDIFYVSGFFSLMSAVFIGLYALAYFVAMTIGVLILISFIVVNLVIIRRYKEKKITDPNKTEKFPTAEVLQVLDDLFGVMQKAYRKVYVEYIDLQEKLGR